MSASESRPAGARRPLIAHVLHRFAMGGLENGLVNLVNRLPREEFDHAIVSLTDASSFRERLERPDVTVHTLNKRPGTDLGVHRRFWRLMRELRPAIVHTRNIAALEFQWTARLAGVRFGIHGEHGWDASDPQGLNRRHRQLRRLTRAVVDTYVPMSRDIERWLTDVIGVRPDRIRQLYNGVDTLRFSPAGTCVRLGVEGGSAGREGLVVGTLGRLDPIKNQGLLIEAMARLTKRLPEHASRLRIAVIGDGPMRAELLASLERAGLASRAWLPGARSDVAAVLRGLDVFVLPSLNEGISNTILEAMASGLPVVATRVGGNPELVVDGETGALTAPNDADALADAIARYVESPELRSRHGAAGRARVESHFSLESMIRGYRAVYHDGLETRR